MSDQLRFKKISGIESSIATRLIERRNINDKFSQSLMEALDEDLQEQVRKERKRVGRDQSR